ncbi:unnamed protein product, partial [marine sediment metagenome]
MDELLCLGHGKFDVEQIFIGDTPIDTLEAGTVQYWLFDQDEHLETMGTIEDLIWADISAGPNPYPFVENMFTSPEVEQFQFEDITTEEPTTPAAFDGEAVAGTPGHFLMPGAIGVNPFPDIVVGDT